MPPNPPKLPLSALKLKRTPPLELDAQKNWSLAALYASPDGDVGEAASMSMLALTVAPVVRSQKKMTSKFPGVGSSCTVASRGETPPRTAITPSHWNWSVKIPTIDLEFT